MPKELNETEFNQRQDLIQGFIAQHIGVKPEELESIFCVERVTESDDVGAAFNSVAHPGRCQVVVTPADYGNSTSRTYRSEILTDPTWLDIAKAFEASLAVTGDSDHRFLELVDAKGAIDGITQLEVFAGS